MQNSILAMPMEVHKKNKHEKQEVGLPLSMFFLAPSSTQCLDYKSIFVKFVVMDEILKKSTPKINMGSPPFHVFFLPLS
jgi:hypothetical protein